MKKILFALSAAVLVACCKKVPEGGNKGVLKLEEGAEHYSNDVQGADSASMAHNHGTAVVSNEVVDITLGDLVLKGKKGGLENQIVDFLKSPEFTNGTEESIKNRWFDFDNVSFKMGSSNQLESGAEQLQNLAQILKKYPEAKIKIGGYTDKKGDEQVNLKISNARASFIKSELDKLGVGAQVVSAEGYGSKFATVAAEATDEERAKDRKMSIRFTK